AQRPGRGRAEIPRRSQDHPSPPLAAHRRGGPALGAARADDGPRRARMGGSRSRARVPDVGAAASRRRTARGAGAQRSRHPRGRGSALPAPGEAAGLMQAWRITKVRHPPYDGTGARLYGARWNSAGRPLIYASDTFAGALLESIAHSLRPRTLPGSHHAVRIEIPDEVVEIVAPEAVPGWESR